MPTFTVTTRPAKDKPEVKTSLTVITEGVKPEVVMALAMQALVVKWQGHARKHGIPAAASINMADFAPGTRHAAPSLQQSVAALSAEERAKLIAQLQAMK